MTKLCFTGATKINREHFLFMGDVGAMLDQIVLKGFEYDVITSLFSINSHISFHIMTLTFDLEK